MAKDLTDPQAALAPAASSAVTATPAYRRYVLGLLLAAGILNYFDRQIINILVEPIKRDLHLSDGQLGLITGFSFALFYSVLGIPIARLADRSHRPWIIATALAVWSGFTLACGFAQSFTHMLLARVGVGCGEAGGTPPSHSLISDFTTPQNRASALAIFSLGTPIGALLGLTVGGVIGGALGWRTAFMVAATPGLIIAVVIALTVREPRRDPGSKLAAQASMSMLAALGELRRKRSFWWIAGATTCCAFVNSGQGAFYGSYFMRRHGEAAAALHPGMTALALVGTALGVALGVGGGLGTLAGGLITDRALVRDKRAYCFVPAAAMVVAAPLYAVMLAQKDLYSAAGALFCLAFMTGCLYGPVFSAIQTLVSPRARATAAALLFFIMNIIGLGLGPVVIGLLSDHFAVTLGGTAGLARAMLVVSPIILIAVFCFWRASRSIGRELYLET